MAKNQSTYTLKIDAELGNLQQILNQAKNSLSSLMASGNAPKGLEKAFEKINDLLGQISDKTGKPLDLKGLAATGKDLTSIQENFKAIIRLLGEFDDLSEDIKLSFLSGDEQKKIQDASNALSDYAKAIEEVAKKQKLLDDAQKTNTKDKSTLDKAKKKVGGLQDEKTLIQARLSGTQTKLNAAKGLENVNPKDIAKYEAEVTKLNAELEILDKNLNEANAELDTAQTAYNTSAQSIKRMEAEIKRASGASLKQLKEEATALGISLDGLNGHNAAKQVEILTDRLEEFKQETMKGAKPAFDAIKQGCEKAEEAADGLQDELKGAIDVTQQMDEVAAQRDAFEAKIKSFLGLSGAAQVLRASLRDAMQTITELDAVMGQMAVVTDLTVGDYWDQLPQYSERASKLGVSITSAYEAATLYYQQGLKTNEVTALSEQTLKMAAIAGLDAADATDRMTAALRGFNMELNEANAQNVADVYSELAAITAANVDEISTAMTKTASIASSAGMEFETTAAFLSQIIETTRESAETAGTAMKTVIARFQELKKSPSEIGEIDGEIVDANAIETALRSVGVSLRDSSGQFRKLDEVFLELSSKWDTLDKNTQRYIATIAAGSRQQSRFIAMMSDYSRTQELVTAANTSAGASNKQFEKTMDTLEYKVNQLKNAWHEFTMGIMNSDLVKFGVDTLTKFLEVVNKATSALDGVGGSLTKIISVVGIFKLGKQIFDKFMPTISGFFTNVTKEAYTGGVNAGKAFQQGLEDSKKQSTSGAQGKEAEDRKSENKEDVKRTGWQKLGDKTIGLGKWQEAGEHGKKRKDALKDLKELEKGSEEYNKKQQEVLKEGKQQWDAYGKAVGQVGQTITGAGIAMSAIGGILSSLGLEEVGDTLSGIGNWITIIGSGVSTLGPLVAKLVGTLVAGGVSTMVAWAWVAGVAAAVMLLVVGVVALFKHIQENSPEGQLKKAKEAAEQAAEAAERAKESYDGLANTFDDLKDKYKALEELKRGTQEWNKAVLEINSSVMDLIKQYPELAKFVKNTDGILKIDFEEAGVKEVLNKAFEASVGASNIALAADINVLDKELGTERSNLQEKYNLKYKTDRPRNKYQNYINLTKEQIDLYAKAYADGKLTGKGSEINLQNLRKEMKLSEEEFASLQINIKGSEGAILEYGRSIQSKEQQEKVAYDSIANAVVSLVDTMGQSEDRIKQMFNIADGEAYQKVYDEMEAKLTDDLINVNTSFGKETPQDFLDTIGMTQDQLNEAFAQNYKEASYDIVSREVTYKDEDGKTVTKPLENDEIRRIISTYYSSNTLKKQAEYSSTYITEMSQQITQGEGANGKSIAESFEKALLDESGETLTTEDFENLLKLTKTDMETYFNNLPENLKNAYGSVDGLWSKFYAARKSASYLARTDFQGVTVGAAKNLDKIKGAMGTAQGNNFQTQFNKILYGLEDGQKEYFAQQIASLASDPTNREAWDAALERLIAEGIDVSEFIANQQTALDARYSDTFLQNMGVSDDLISQYANASGDTLDKFHETFKKWRKDYNTVNDDTAKEEHELIEKTIEAIIESQEKQIDAYEEAVNAEAEANSNLISKISDNVARLRDLREKEETEKAISDNLSKQAYLSMDTSGSNALELLRLQEESTQMSQDYEDSLIDQAITKLEDDNQKALKQREKQIQLMRDQLDIYKNSEDILTDAKKIIKDATNTLFDGGDLESTQLYTLLGPEQFVSEFDKSQFSLDLKEKLSKLIPDDPQVEVSNKTGIVNTGTGRIITQTHYKTGGLADFTGPAWLDGTPSKPEYILNAAQTERFFSLVDVLEGMDRDKISDKTSGDNYFDINISVDKLENDYDVEQVANKIRGMIYEDATYRNVNAISHIR